MTGAFQRLAFVALAASLAAAAVGPARAQDIPAGQSCGGLFCDLGIVGHKTAPAPPAAPAPVAAPTTTVVAPEAAVAPAPRVRRHLARVPVARRHLAKVAAPTPREAPVARMQPAALPAAPAARLAARPAAPAEPLLAAPIAAAPPPAAPARAPVRTTQQPLIFQSIDPMLQ